MATTTGPDLTVAREAVEALMDDTCIVTRPGDPDDDVLDIDTGEIGSSSTATPVYGPDTLGFEDRELGSRCKFKPASDNQPDEQEWGGDTRPRRFYSIGLPWDAPDVQEGDKIDCTSSRRDPLLVGQTFIVREVVYSTMLVQRRVTAENVG